MTPRIVSGSRVTALLLTAIVLLATSTSPPPAPDSADFDAATACGPAATVTLRTENLGDHGGGCSNASNDLVHVDGGAATGLPVIGEIEYASWKDRTFPGETILRSRMILFGNVQLPGAIPTTTVTRSCRLEPASRDVLSVTCEGPDPESACTGALTIRPVTP